MSESYFNSPGALLAVAFPPQYGLRGACVTIRDLSGYEYRIPRLMSTSEVVHLVISRNLECRAPGRGNRAKRRIRSLRLARSAHFHDLPLGRPHIQ